MTQIKNSDYSNQYYVQEYRDQGGDVWDIQSTVDYIERRRQEDLAAISTEENRALSLNAVALAEIQSGTQRLAIDEAGRTADLQRTAFLTAQLDTLDTKLQTAVLNFKKDAFVESNRLVEKKTEIQLRAVENRIERRETDIPSPDFDSF